MSFTDKVATGRCLCLRWLQALSLLLGRYLGTEWLRGVVGLCLTLKKAARPFSHGGAHILTSCALDSPSTQGLRSAGLAPALKKDLLLCLMAHQCERGLSVG